MEKTLDSGSLEELLEHIKDMLEKGSSMVAFVPDPEDSDNFSCNAILAIHMQKVMEGTEEAAGNTLFLVSSSEKIVNSGKCLYRPFRMICCD